MKTISASEITWPKRSEWGHKGSYGQALLIGGSRGMSGAIALAGKAALLTGAGLVRLALPDRILETVAAQLLEATSIPLKDDKHGRISPDAYEDITKQANSAKAVAIGPGLGRSLGLNALVVKVYENVSRPLVVDADALNALAERNFFTAENRTPPFPRILTPHPGEFSRLTTQPILKEDASLESAEARRNAAVEFARKTGTIVLLKGHRTVITDGTTLAINTTGNPGMGTGGSGDVLTGVITALLAQGFPALEAAVLGAHLHGLAGDIAAEKVGEPSLTAGEIARHLPKALQSFSNRF